MTADKEELGIGAGGWGGSPRETKRTKAATEGEIHFISKRKFLDKSNLSNKFFIFTRKHLYTV